VKLHRAIRSACSRTAAMEPRGPPVTERPSERIQALIDAPKGTTLPFTPSDWR
jgi:hypothetical protein